MIFLLIFCVMMMVACLLARENSNSNNGCISALGCFGMLISLISGCFIVRYRNEINDFFAERVPMDSILANFVVGGVFFWLITLGVIVTITALEENNKSVWAWVSVALYLGLIEFVFKAGWFHYLFTHPLHLGLGVAGFLLGGVITPFPKWKWYCEKIVDVIDQWKSEFFQDVLKGNYRYNNDIKEEEKEYALRGEFNEALTKVWKNKFAENWKSQYPGKTFPPKVQEHKQKIISWMTLWPVVITWAFFGDFLTKIFRLLYARIAGYLQSISDRMFSKFNAEIQ